MTAGVKSGKAQNEHMFSGLPPKADLLPILDYFRRNSSRMPPSRPRASQHSRAWGVRFLVDITPCQGLTAAAVGPAQYRSWQGRLISVRAILSSGKPVYTRGQILQMAAMRRKGEVNDQDWLHWERELIAAGGEGHIRGGLDADGNPIS